MILLDTNVISEMMKANPDAGVKKWLGAQPETTVFISSITEAELHYGTAILPAGRRRTNIEAEIASVLAEYFAERTLPFDSAAAVAYGAIAAARRLARRPISQFDGQIAAIARSRGATLASRNASDFQNCGIGVINPWALGTEK